eukprot:1138770-Pelagomonas_calceolata.AAC.5
MAATGCGLNASVKQLFLKYCWEFNYWASLHCDSGQHMQELFAACTSNAHFTALIEANCRCGKM